ncbi:hypothetical protein NC651_002874 [Populus alba x Populus x berolinensis]|nr:hypothetical protein NC651_002874 [Populus alba x Populus x berolinensis]
MVVMVVGIHGGCLILIYRDEDDHENNGLGSRSSDEYCWLLVAMEHGYGGGDNHGPVVNSDGWRANVRY